MAEGKLANSVVPSGEPKRVEPRGTEVDLRYVRYEPLGSGALAAVYRGKHTGLGYEVAIKELRDVFAHFPFLQRGEVVKRLRRELSGQATLRHPAVVAILDQNLDVARPYFVIELCSGGSLRRRLETNRGGLPVDEALRLLVQIGSALEAAHATGLVHQGIRPENVVLDGFGNAKLSDFGMARVLEHDGGGAPPFFIGAASPSYLSPELLGRAGAAGPESDVYALGILLYEVLAGTVPGRRSPLPSAIRSEVPKELDPIFERMTADRREDRPPGAGAVLDELFGALGERLGKRDELVLRGRPAS